MVTLKDHWEQADQSVTVVNEPNEQYHDIKRRNGKTPVQEPKMTETKEPNVTETSDVANGEYVMKPKKGGIPHDRGWAWLVLLGACIEMTIVIGMIKSSGLLFVAFQEQFKSSSSDTSLVSTVQNATFSFSALLVMTVLTKLVDIRKLVIFGSFLNCVAFVIASQATSIRFLLMYGILQGMGTSFMHPTTITMVGQYFDRRRGLANSIAVSGGSLGGLFLAPLITYLLFQYGYRGCMLILAGVFLHVSISGTLYRPPSFYTNRHSDRQKDLKEKSDNVKSSEDDANAKLLTDANHDIGDKQMVLHSEVINGLRNGHLGNGVDKSGANGNEAIDPRLLGSEPLLSGLPKNIRKRTFTESCGTGHFLRQMSHNSGHDHRSREYMAGSHMDIPGFDDTYDESNNNTSTDDVSKKTNGCCRVFKRITDLFDFTLFKDPVFILMELAFGFTCASCSLTSVFIAPYAREVGLDTSSVATMITIFSAVDLVCRLGIGVIADFNFARRSTLIAICGIMIALSSFLLKFYTSYGLVVFYAVILGLFTGGYFALFAVVIVDYFTVAKLHSVLGFTTLFHGTFIATTFFVAGALRDITGSYVGSFHFLGAETLLGALLFLSLPYVERIRDSKTTQRDIVV